MIKKIVVDTALERRFIRRRMMDFCAYSDKEPVALLFRKYVLARIYVTLSIILFCLTALFEPLSSYHRVFLDTRVDPQFLYGLLLVCGFCLADIIINDIAPDKYVYKYVYDRRHIFYMSLAIGCFSISGAIAHTYGTSFYLGSLWLNGIIAAVIGVMDIFVRHKGHKWRSCMP